MTQREAFEAWSRGIYRGIHEDMVWAAWQAATRHAAQLALDAPVKTSRQESREACANWILGGME